MLTDKHAKGNTSEPQSVHTHGRWQKQEGEMEDTAEAGGLNGGYDRSRRVEWRIVSRNDSCNDPVPFDDNCWEIWVSSRFVVSVELGCNSR
jgi:hypothetical protein